MSGGVIVRMEHIRAARMCAKGTRQFFRKHDMDWSLFLQEGLPEEDFLRTGDAMARRVVEIARGQA